MFEEISKTRSYKDQISKYCLSVLGIKLKELQQTVFIHPLLNQMTTEIHTISQRKISRTYNVPAK